MYDLIVVGGGPAGSICARTAAQAGLDVLLLEKDKHPRYKLCGGALSKRVEDLLDFDIDHIIERTVSSIKLAAGYDQSSTWTREDTTGILVKREKFDQVLFQHAKNSGAETIENCRVIRVEQTRRGLRVLARGDSFKGHLVVGADGVNSIVAKTLSIREKWPADAVALCIGGEAKLSVEEMSRVITDSKGMSNPALEIYFGLVKWGYGWCFPHSNHLNIGIGCRMSQNVDLKKHWSEFLKQLEIMKGIDIDIRNQSAFRIPLGGENRRVITRRSMLVGDAAGLVSPVTGEGIYYALKSGVLAAKIATKAVREKSPLLIRTYQDQLEKTIIEELSVAKFLAKMIFKSKKTISLALEVAEKDSIIRNYMIDFVTGLKPASEMKRKMMKHMLRHHPLKAIRIGLT
ncbi:MAG: geranylgeranyl reductase family protein [Candidatus Lokiarchaeota archaeon]|nr:geranylgeranyl reductase family protein [Candidatus Lokiarchaeota archaeon]